jgi:hypothetical protein
MAHLRLVGRIASRSSIRSIHNRLVRGDVPDPTAFDFGAQLFNALMLLLALGMLLGMAKLAHAGPSTLANVAPTEVDVALVLAVDASSSMDEGERRMQRDGYATALVSDRVLQAIKFGHKGKIAVTYFEWGSQDAQYVIAPWTIIDGPEAARHFSQKIASEPWHDLQRTSISAALAFAGDLLSKSGLHPEREVIDVSGDGPNNEGVVVSEARDALVQRGVVINGLPIVTKSPDDWLTMPDLDEYYEHCVIGGEGSFMIPVRGMTNFGAALEMKLVMEIAGIKQDKPRIIPAADHDWSTCHLYE